MNKSLLKIISAATISIMACMSYAYADSVYKWVDEDGITHYGDDKKIAKSKKAETLNVSGTGSLNGTGAKPKVNYNTSKYTPQAVSINANSQADINYSIGIGSPSNGETIRANDGTINVTLNINPIPRNDYSIKIFLDNSLFGSTFNSNRVSLRAVPAGEHIMTAKMINKNGKIIASSPIKFNVLRNSILNPHNPHAKNHK